MRRSKENGKGFWKLTNEQVEKAVEEAEAHAVKKTQQRIELRPASAGLAQSEKLARERCGVRKFCRIYAALRFLVASGGGMIPCAFLVVPNAFLTTTSPIKYANTRIKNIDIYHSDYEESLSLADE